MLRPEVVLAPFIAGPLVFGLVSQAFGTGRLGIAALVFFFAAALRPTQDGGTELVECAAGARLLALVDEKEGGRVADFGELSRAAEEEDGGTSGGT